MGERTLKAIWWQSHDDYLEVGKGGVSSITLSNIGCGPMGYYDVVTVVWDDGESTNYPAHFIHGWIIASGERQ